ncbi:MAG: hypothetical protein ACLFQX_13775 [Candidatus Kapaibacterium sp.]
MGVINSDVSGYAEIMQTPLPGYAGFYSDGSRMFYAALADDPQKIITMDTDGGGRIEVPLVGDRWTINTHLRSNYPNEIYLSNIYIKNNYKTFDFNVMNLSTNAVRKLCTDIVGKIR